MKSINLFVPQWQGAGVFDDLYKGAAALRKYIGEDQRPFYDIQISRDPSCQIENNIFAYSTIRHQLDLIKSALYRDKPETVFTVGGGCGIEIPIVSHLASLYKDMDLFWFDAHGDLNTPDSSPSKFFHGMPLRFLLEDIPRNEISSEYGRINCEDVTLLGSRDLDEPELAFIKKNRIKHLKPGDNCSPESQSITGSSNQYAYIHIDLDVLDPREYKNVKCPSRDGYSVRELAQFIRSIRDKRKVVGISLLENTEVNREKLTVLDELLDLVRDIFPSGLIL